MYSVYLKDKDDCEMCADLEVRNLKEAKASARLMETDPEYANDAARIRIYKDSVLVVDRPVRS